MIDWTKGMNQTYEFYTVDPNTWKDKDKIDCITSCTINRDESNETLGSATFECTEELGECYIRVYLIAIQNGVTEKVPLGTFLVQTPSTSFDGKVGSYSLDAYTPLIELKEGSPPIGYSLLEGQPILEIASNICRERMRAPVVATKSEKTLYRDFVSNTNDTWITYIRDLVYNADHKPALDELGRLMFDPIQDTAALRPVTTFDDSNSSILLPTIKNKRDLYGIPNVVEVVYSTDAETLFSRIVNDDPSSPISTVNRGREILYRDTNPSVSGKPDQEYIDNYAVQMLRKLSCLEHTVTYSHGYYPVRVGDCVLLDYKRSGIINTKARIISQSIKCGTGCVVEETATYTTKLWR